MKGKPKKNDRFNHFGREAKVMVCEDGWVMARIKGCIPFVILATEIEDIIYSKPSGAKW